VARRLRGPLRLLPSMSLCQSSAIFTLVQK
jgi:hypothetical protein